MGYAPLEVVFTNTSRNEVTGTDWDFGDGQTGTDPEPVHVYATPGTYDVSLTATGPGGTDTLTQPDLIEVVQDNQPPVVTIESPAENAVVASGDVVVTGTVTDDGTVVSVLVNEVAATLDDETFTTTISLDNGNALIAVMAEDDGGAMGFAGHLVRVDGEGPMIGIQAPKPGQTVYTLTPEIDITYTDFYSAVNTASVQVEVIDESSVATDVTGDLTITDTGAQGTLSVPLTDDASYTLRVSVADTFGNVTQREARFHVAATIVPPDEPEGAGWITGTVYDSTNCSEHLQGCEPLSGARVTVTEAGSGFPGTGPGDSIAGTVVTGPTGFFAFPLGETNVYWLSVRKDGYTFAQREVEVVREHSTVTNDIYLTPIDSAVTPCDETGCSHESSDGLLQVEIPAGAIPAGQIIDVTATNFRNVEFLPSGRLPEGTWETYAFDVGGETEITFEQPVTVRIQNYRNFDPGEQIPLGYWNQERMAWEPEGFGIVDATGDWVEMSITHFSMYDCNDPVAPLQGVGADGTDHTNGNGPGPCAKGEGKCFIDFKSGTFTEDYSLLPVPVLGQDVAPPAGLQQSPHRAVRGDRHRVLGRSERPQRGTWQLCGD